MHSWSRILYFRSGILWKWWFNFVFLALPHVYDFFDLWFLLFCVEISVNAVLPDVFPCSITSLRNWSASKCIHHGVCSGAPSSDLVLSFFIYFYFILFIFFNSFLKLSLSLSILPSPPSLQIRYVLRLLY
jgi:hypothetical protein